MINLKNLDKWHHLVSGEMMSFSNPNPRTVRVEVNAPFETRLYVTPDGGKEATFLCLVAGLDVVTFGTDGSFTLYGDGDFSLYSSEVESVAFEVLEPAIYTEIAERRARNPELEYMMSRMQENMERRIAQTTAEFQNRIDTLQEATHVNPTAIAPKPAEPEPVPAADGAKSGQDPAGDGGAASSLASVEPAK